MNSIVVDTNVLVTILVNPTEKIVNFCTGHEMHTPNLLKLELVNVLRKYHTLQNLPLEIVLDYLTKGYGLISEFYPNEVVLENAIKFSFELNHPIYDCIYLGLAHELNMPFVSQDKRLIVKAKTLGIKGLILDDFI